MFYNIFFLSKCDIPRVQTFALVVVGEWEGIARGVAVM